MNNERILLNAFSINGLRTNLMDIHRPQFGVYLRERILNKTKNLLELTTDSLWFQVAITINEFNKHN